MKVQSAQPKPTSPTLCKKSKARNLLRACIESNIAVFLLLLAGNIICCGSSLNMYFFAEDAVHVVHAHKFFQGYSHYFWTNFYGVWMNDNVHTCFYRPIPELTFALDYMLFGTKAWGYHLTNLLWHQFATFAFFAASQALLASYGKLQSRASALIAAAAFAACPLHPEAVNWLVNRTDLICMVFMMVAWHHFIKATQVGSKAALVLSLSSSLIALMCKESAIAIPPLMALTYLFLKSEKLAAKEIWRSLKTTFAFWLLLLAYVAFRFAVLHGPGGYVGSLATMMADTFVERLTSTTSWVRCFYPLNECLPKELLYAFGPLLATVYAVAGVLVIARFNQSCWSSANTKLLLFAAGAFLVTAAPSIQLWSILSNLLNSRLMYIPSAFLALIVIATILPIGLSLEHHKRFWRFGVAWSLVFICVAGAAHIVNNEPWHWASENLKGLGGELIKTLRRLPPSDSVAVLNLPLDERNPLSMCCRWHLIAPVVPPFCNTDFGPRIVATQMSWFNSEIKNPSRIRDFVNVSTNHGLLWDTSTKTLVDCAQGEFPALGASLDESRPMVHRGSEFNEPSLIYTLPQSGLDARLAGLIKVSVSAIPGKSHESGKLPLCTVIWNSHDRPEVTTWRTMARRAQKSHPQTVYFPVAERVRWALSPQRLKQLIVTPANGYEVKSIELLNETSVTPSLKATGTQYVSRDGHYVFDKELIIAFDCSKIDGADKTIIEVSAPNLRPHELSSTYRDTQLNSHSHRRIIVDSTNASFTLTRSMFGQSAKYDVRVAAVSADHEVVGFTSDPLEVDVR